MDLNNDSLNNTLKYIEQHTKKRAVVKKIKEMKEGNWTIYSIRFHN